MLFKFGIDSGLSFPSPADLENQGPPRLRFGLFRNYRPPIITPPCVDPNMNIDDGLTNLKIDPSLKSLISNQKGS